MKELIQELKEVVDWRQLGEELGMEAQMLQGIERSNKENEHKKRAMIRCVRVEFLLSWILGAMNLNHMCTTHY